MVESLTIEKPALVVEGGPEHGQVIPLLDTTGLGRQSGNEVVAVDPGVSRQHAAITRGQDGYHLRDLSSSNGTFVNGTNITVEDHLLEDGDSIQLGRSDVKYVFRAPASQTLQMTMVHTAVQPAVGGPLLGGKSETESRPQAEPDEEDELYEGNVRLNLQAEGNLGLIITMTQQLREKPEFRLLRLANNPDGGVDVWLGLRQPVPLRVILQGVDGVADIVPVHEPETEGGDDQVFNVLLRADVT